MAAYPITLPVVTVTTAGTAVPLSATQIFASTIVIEADTLNTGNIYWGGVDVSATKGNTLVAEQSNTLTADLLRYDLSHGNNQKLDLSQIYVDADTNGNKVRVSYMLWSSGL